MIYTECQLNLSILKCKFSVHQHPWSMEMKIFKMFDILLLIVYGHSIYKHVLHTDFTWLSNGQVCRGMLRCIWLIREMAVFLLSFVFLLCKNNSRGIKTTLNKFWVKWMTTSLLKCTLKKFCLKSNLNFKHQSNRYNFENDEI